MKSPSIHHHHPPSSSTIIKQRTKHSEGSTCACQCGKPQITNFDNALTAIDKNIVTLEVSVDDGGLVTMQVDQPAKNLPCPSLEHLIIRMLVAFAIPVCVERVGC